MYRQRQIALEALPWLEDTATDPETPTFDPISADSILKKLDPLDYHYPFSTLSNGSFLHTVRENRIEKQALVAAADLRASYKATKMARFPRGASAPYGLHTVNDPHIPVVVDTGASISLTPNISDFIGPIKAPNLKSLHGLGEPTSVEWQGIIEWQAGDVLGTVRTIRTHGYLVKTAPIRLFSP
jgi:hypothetical protein